MKSSLSLLSASIMILMPNWANAQEEVVAEKAAPQTTGIMPSVVLPAVYVSSVPRQNDIGRTYYDAEKLQNTPAINRTITEMLKQHPNVQFDRADQAAGTQGEIFATDFSINGALQYDNQILLNNASIANEINPVGGDNSFVADKLPGSAQTATINTALLCELSVLDSNVSAEYGGFVGGVVKAKTCVPNTSVGKIHGKISYDYTSSDWTKYNYVNASELEDFDKNNNINYQKDFKKQGLSATVYGKPTNNLGLSLSLSRRLSDIYLKANLPDARPYNQQRTADNAMLDAEYQINANNSVKLNLSYTNNGSLRYQPNVADSKHTVDQQNYIVDLSFSHDLPNFQLKHALVYKQEKQQRKVSSDEYISWRKSAAKDWGVGTAVNEGTTGTPLEQNGSSWQYQLKAAFNPYENGRFSHQMTVGASLNQQQADWRRTSDYYWYFIPEIKGANGTDCQRADGSIDKYCDSTYERNNKTVGQYHTRRTYYQAGAINLKQLGWSAFTQHKLTFGQRLTVNLGLRYDDDNMTKKATIAPRFHLTYQPFANSDLALTLGANRYYGRNAFNLSLQDGIKNFAWDQRRTNLDDNWQTIGNLTGARIARNILKSPSTDEYVAGITAKAYNTNWQLQYTRRNYQDQIRQYRVSTTPLVWAYDNLGKSQSDIYSLKLTTAKPLKLFGGEHQLSVGGSYTKTLRNFNDFDDSTLRDDPYVLYQGRVIEHTDLPAVNYNQPWRATLSIHSRFNRLSLNNQLSYRAGQVGLAKSTLPADKQFDHAGSVVRQEYSKKRMGGVVNWDLNARYEFGGAYQLALGLTAKNLLNRKSQYLSGADVRSEVGRQYLAQVDFVF